MPKTDKILSFLIIVFVIRISIFKVARTTISFDAYTILQIIAVMSIFALMIFSRKIHLRRFIKNKPVLFLLLVYMLGIVSFFWSELPFFSGYMAIQNLVFVLAFIYLFSRKQSLYDLEGEFIKFSFILIFIDFLGDLLLYK